MKRSNVVAVFFTATLMIVILLASHNVSAQSKPKPWNVPEAEKAKKSIVKAGDATAITTGKELWMKHCKSCHGAKGLGDGAKAATLKTEAGDFSTATFQKQTDGELYYKVAKGRDDMPGYEKKIPDAADMWSVVAFMRTLKK
jgi:mono/diheme cytochrome c family protein